MSTCFHAFLLSCFHASMLTCYHTFMFSCFYAPMIQVIHVRISISTHFKKYYSLTDSETWPLIQMLSHLIITTNPFYKFLIKDAIASNNYWSRMQKLWQYSICKDVIPCHSMLSCFHASKLPCFHAFMLQYFHDSMIPASMLSGLHVRQVRHLRFSISTKFKKCD